MRVGFEPTRIAPVELKSTALTTRPSHRSLTNNFLDFEYNVLHFRSTYGNLGNFIIHRKDWQNAFTVSGRMFR
jgi:hypothetical protein